MDQATYHGSCHCGAVRFEIDADLSRLTACNCSICTKKGSVHVRVQPQHFRLIAGEGALREYQFNTRRARHLFCATCGIHPFSHPRAAPEQYAVNVRCLDDFDLADATGVRAFDGRNWEDAVKTFSFN